MKEDKMIECPICKTNTKEVNQEYCYTCAWEFEYFLGELSEREKQKYYKRLQVVQTIYEKSIRNPQDIVIKKEQLEVEIPVEVSKPEEDKKSSNWVRTYKTITDISMWFFIVLLVLMIIVVGVGIITSGAGVVFTTLIAVPVGILVFIVKAITIIKNAKKGK